MKKINALSIVLIIATIIGVGLDIIFKGPILYQAFIEGFRDGFMEVKSQANDMELTFSDILFFIFFIVWVVSFIKLIIHYIDVLRIASRGEVFSEDLERRTSQMGIGIIVIYAAEWAMSLLIGIEAIEDCPSFGVLCCGIGLMIVAQIFALGRKMKEDQEYMV